MYVSSIISSSNDWLCSDNGEAELSSSVAIKADTDEEAEEQQTEDETDELPDAPSQWSWVVFMGVAGGLNKVKVISHFYFYWILDSQIHL